MLIKFYISYSSSCRYIKKIFLNLKVKKKMRIKKNEKESLIYNEGCRFIK
jgi:hypothetical protein